MANYSQSFFHSSRVKKKTNQDQITTPLSITRHAPMATANAPSSSPRVPPPIDFPAKNPIKNSNDSVGVSPTRQFINDFFHIIPRQLLCCILTPGCYISMAKYQTSQFICKYVLIVNYRIFGNSQIIIATNSRDGRLTPARPAPSGR